MKVVKDGRSLDGLLQSSIRRTWWRKPDSCCAHRGLCTIAVVLDCECAWFGVVAIEGSATKVESYGTFLAICADQRHNNTRWLPVFGVYRSATRPFCFETNTFGRQRAIHFQGWPFYLHCPLSSAACCCSKRGVYLQLKD